MADAPALRVSVAVASQPRQVLETSLQLPANASLADVVRVCQALPLFAGLDLPRMPAGIWGRKVGPAQLLRDGDRVEFYRPQLVDPKLARRERFVQQGARTTGLFAKKRPGAKSGY